MTPTVEQVAQAASAASAASENITVRPESVCRPGERGRLTSREATIARMLVEGMNEREVAAELFLGAVALRAHLTRICAKLDIPSPGDLVHVIGRGTTLDFDPERVDRTAGGEPPTPTPGRLTPQEDAVYSLLRDGFDEREVAAELFIGIGAVRSHVAHIQEKLGVE